jgi:Transposase DDE domain
LTSYLRFVHDDPRGCDGRVASTRRLPTGVSRSTWSSALRCRTVGAKPALLETYLATSVRFVFADGGFAGRLLDWAQSILQTTLRIVRKPADQRGFAVIPRRWAVERTFAWLTAHRRLARDYERDPALSEAMIRWAAINTMTRRIARGGPAIRQQRREFTTTS